MSDLLVVGLDLSTGEEVHASGRPTWEWRLKGHNGDRSLVCLDCYQGSAPSGEPTAVALVPKGKLGGARCRHFAHPAGLGPPGGHSNETTWHATGKQRIARWAASHGASTRVEAYTADRKRRSDVAVTLPAGHQLAIEVQLGAVSDAEWLARHRDYAAVGVTDIWLWHGTTWVPRVMFEAGQPGWILDQDNDRLGLLYARPTIGSGTREASKGCGEVHWPPCIDDPIAIQWMALDMALLTPEGIQPAPRANEDLAHKAATARTARENAAARTRTYHQQPSMPAPQTCLTRPATGPQLVRPAHPHEAMRYDAYPPWSDPRTWLYRCPACGRDNITGAELDASPVVHIVPTVPRLPAPGEPLITYVRYGSNTDSAEQSTSESSSTANAHP